MTLRLQIELGVRKIGCVARKFKEFAELAPGYTEFFSDDQKISILAFPKWMPFSLITIKGQFIVELLTIGTFLKTK